MHPHEDHRNVFGVPARYGGNEDLAGSKWPHVMRLRALPARARPGLTVRFRPPAKRVR